MPKNSNMPSAGILLIGACRLTCKCVLSGKNGNMQASTDQ